MSDNNDLFIMVMEAEGDEIAPFDSTGSDMGVGGDAPAEDIAPPATEDASGGDEDNSAPPEMDDAGLDIPDLGSDDSGGDSTGDDTGDSGSSDAGDSSNDEADQKDEKLSDKANNILNEQLFNRLTKRNADIEEIINNVQELVPLLPYDVVKSNDESMSQLKTALSRGQQYAINDFVELGYGENLLFFNQLNALYTMLLNRIDTNLKKIKKS